MTTEPSGKISTRFRGWDSLKLFNTIQELSGVYFARISFQSNTVKIYFYSRPNIEFVCQWKFDKYFFNNELKDLFNKHNSVITEKGVTEK